MLQSQSATSTIKKTITEKTPIQTDSRGNSRDSNFGAIYLTAYTASNFNKIIAIASEAQKYGINAFVIDIKDFSGLIAFPIKNELINQVQSGGALIKNPEKLITALKELNFYLVARIQIFQDPILAQIKPEIAIKNTSGTLWTDFKGLNWIDPYSEWAWKYNAEIAKEAFGIGFDEVNFDYVRFPSDGILSDMVYPLWEHSGLARPDALEQFFKFLNKELNPFGKPISIDVFGLSVVNYDDLGIGQILEKTISYFDFVMPMVYPSHYAPGFLGFENPANYPYEVVFESLSSAKKRIGEENFKKIRPWYQAFNLKAIYDKEKIQAEIQAGIDSGLQSGWAFWNAANIYEFENLNPKQ